MKFRIFVVALFLSGFMAIPAYAADLKAPESPSTNVTVGTDTVWNNLYVAGSNVTVDAPVLKDLVAAGGNVTVNDPVAHSVLIAGGTVSLKSDVGQNVRVMGGTVDITGSIGEDLLVAGGTVTIDSNTVVKGDLLVAGGTVTVNGKVDGTLRATGGDIIINGQVGKDVIAKQISTLELGSTSVIGGKLSYSSPVEATIATTARVVGGVDYQKISYHNNGVGDSLAGLLVFSALMKALAWLVMALILVYGFARSTAHVVEQNKTKFGLSLGIGFIAIIVVPVSIVLFTVSLIGSSLAAVLGLLFILALILSGAFAAIWIGSEIVRLISKSKTARLDWLSALIGVIALMVLGVIPVLGWLACGVIFLSTFGVLVRILWSHFPQKA
ncbi:MAG: polymer-forming cytoskeletal protein [Patescibacteria group bacterium]|jgi:hypothetical protein